MNKAQIRSVVIDSVREYLESEEAEIEVNEDVVLFGTGGIVDSMGLVNIIVDIESKFLDEGFEVSLTSERAVSRQTSPFKTVSTLIEFIAEDIGKEHE